jgi:hypothetical protein
LPGAIALVLVLLLVLRSGLAAADCGPELGVPCLDPTVSAWERFSVSFGFGPDLVLRPETLAGLGCEQFGPDERYWSCATAPAPDPAFDGYVIVRGQDELCGVGAFAELGPDDSGAQSLALAARLGWRLSWLYGPPRTMQDGILWADRFMGKQAHFMFGIFLDWRVWEQTWTLPEGARRETVTLSIASRTVHLGRYHGTVYLAMDHGRCEEPERIDAGSTD